MGRMSNGWLQGLAATTTARAPFVRPAYLPKLHTYIMQLDAYYEVDPYWRSRFCMYSTTVRYRRICDWEIQQRHLPFDASDPPPWRGITTSIGDRDSSKTFALIGQNAIHLFILSRARRQA